MCWGFIGVWLMAGEAHVVTVAVRNENFAGWASGEVADRGFRAGQRDFEQAEVTLEVRRLQ